MEDYTILEMHDINNKIVMVVEDDEKLISIVSSFCEVIPLRFSYDLKKFSNKYITATKALFSYYYNLDDSYTNEILRLKKHFKHFMRYPFILYINKKNSNYELVVRLCNDLKIECISNKALFISKIKNNKKIFLIDSDGTLCNNDGIISVKSKQAIKKIVKKGDYAIICTARPRYHALELMKTVNSSKYIISSNGAEIYDAKSNKIVRSYCVNKKFVYYLINKCYELDLRLVLSADDIDYVTKDIRNSSQILLSRNSYKKQLKKVKIKMGMVIDSKLEVVSELKKKVLLMHNVYIVNEKSKDDSYYEDWFCIGSKNSIKSNGLINISNYLKVPLKNTIAIGNDYNDLPMFKVSKISFAVNNSNDDIKKSADYVVSSNNNDGVAEAIDKVYSN